jgi:hypothetical protein
MTDDERLLYDPGQPGIYHFPNKDGIGKFRKWDGTEWHEGYANKDCSLDDRVRSIEKARNSSGGFGLNWVKKDLASRRTQVLVANLDGSVVTEPLGHIQLDLFS